MHTCFYWWCDAAHKKQLDHPRLIQKQEGQNHPSSIQGDVPCHTWKYQQ